MKKSDSQISELPARSAFHESLRSNGLLIIALMIVWILGRFFITPRIIGGDKFEIVMQVGVAILLAVSLQLINGFSGQFSLGHAGFMAIGAYFSGFASIHFSHAMTDPIGPAIFFFSLLLCVFLAAAALMMLNGIARGTGKIHPSLPGIMIVLILAWIVSDFAIASGKSPVPIYLIFSRGIGGLHSLFNAIIEYGMPTAAKLSASFPNVAQGPICFLVILIGGGICAAIAGLVVGLPTLRLRGDYLAIATLGFAEIIRIAITNARPLGGALGLNGIPIYTNFAWLWGAVIITIAVIGRIAYSAKGRAIMAVREDEIAAASVGIDATHHKVLAFIVGAFFAGFGGSLYAHYTGFITPNDFGITRSIEFVVMVTLGGLGSISGAILAAIVLTILPEVLRGIADWRMVIYSLLLIAMMLLRPGGLLGGRELWRRRKPRDPIAPEDRDTPSIAAA